MNFLQRTPFFRLLLPFIIGVIIYQYVELFQWSLLALFGLSVCLIIIAFVIRKPTSQFQFRWLFGSGIFLFFIALGYILCLNREKENKFDFIHHRGIYEVELTSAPIEKAKSYLCKVKVLYNLDSLSKRPAQGKAYLYVQKDSASSHLLFGDRLMIEATFNPPEKTQNPGGFDYAAYLKRQGIGATAYIPSQRWKHTHRNTASLRREADKCRNYLLKVYRRFDIEGDEFAVLAALTLGYTDDLQPDLRKSYSATGAMHILSVSGMHVGIVYAAMLFLLGFLNRSQRQKVLKTILITLFLWSYAFVTGLSPAVVRSTLMVTFVAIALCLERKSQMYNTIFLSAFLILLINPNLLFDIGFQLSYSAVLSILFFQPPLSALLPTKNKAVLWIRNLLLVSVAAQVGTAPFTLYYFHQFPNYFLLTNLIAIPLSSFVIYFAIGLLMVSFIPFLSTAVAFILKTMLWLLNMAIVGIQHLPYSLSFISLDLKQTLFLFVAVFFLSAYFYTKKFTPLFIGLVSVLLVCVFNLSVKYHTMTSRKMIVYAGQKSTHVNFIQGDQNFVFTTDYTETERIAGSYWQNQKLNNPVYLHKTDWYTEGFACFQGRRILILTDDFLRKKTTFTPLKLDYLIIGNKMKPKISQILECVSPRKIIVDKNISKWYTNQIKQMCIDRKIEFYSVAERGAYILSFID